MINTDRYNAWRLACQNLPTDAAADKIIWLADVYLTEWRRKRQC